MKLSDITANNEHTRTTTPSDGIADPSYGATRNAAYPELAELLTTRTANNLMNCKLLARDELELANLILNQMDVDPHYEPSCLMRDAIRAINAKLALC